MLQQGVVADIQIYNTMIYQVNWCFVVVAVKPLIPLKGLAYDLHKHPKSLMKGQIKLIEINASKL
jgi:hypothetical protein